MKQKPTTVRVGKVKRALTPEQIVEPRNAAALIFPVALKQPKKAKPAVAALVEPAETVTTGSGTPTWMFVVIAVSVGFMLMAAVPVRSGVYGEPTRNVVKARIAVAATGLGLFVGLAVSLLMTSLPMP